MFFSPLQGQSSKRPSPEDGDILCHAWVWEFQLQAAGQVKNIEKTRSYFQIQNQTQLCGYEKETTLVRVSQERTKSNTGKVVASVSLQTAKDKIQPDEAPNNLLSTSLSE